MKMGHLTKIAFVNTMAANDLVLQENRIAAALVLTFF